ncbi:hypothetical protein BJ741DRAFT_671097 [Chytriomyces cf. hyalinus JEL632]|nr:hypothetical protein BJ741DRAFT_671097 [Chytriomyces cf. hyalinus JEL632]
MEPFKVQQRMLSLTQPSKNSVPLIEWRKDKARVSAAKQVAQSTAELCEAANNAVKDNCEMEMVSVKAKAVATSTAQLISAAANSESTPNPKSVSKQREKPSRTRQTNS